MKNKNFILAIDQGTTGTKALIVDHNLSVIAQAYEEFPQHFPSPGSVEHKPDEIWTSVEKTIKKVTQKIDKKKISSIGITNQRETICFWNKKTLKPLANAIVWQDRRTTPLCQELKSKGLEKHFQEKTGLLIDPYFSGTKVAWALENWGDVKNANKNGSLAVGTIDSYLISKLSQGASHVTEPSNASRTLCYHLTHHQWDEELCRTLKINPAIWPEVRPSTGKFASTYGLKFLPDGIPITGVLGDQQSALLGQACTEEGTAKCTYGTGSFILLNTGNKPVLSRHRLLTTIAWALNEKDYTYALEGSAFIAGAAVQWLRDGLKIIKKSSDIEKLAEKVETSEGVTFVPALTGLGAPHWDPHARGLISGITRGTTSSHIARAVLEGIAFQNADILAAMQKDLKNKIIQLNVDGGASNNKLLMQFQADILDTPLIRPKMTETTVLGSVFAAGIGVGLWKDLNEIKKVWKKDIEFKPKFSPEERKKYLSQWNIAVEQSKQH